MEKKEEILRVRNLDISFETTAGVVNAVRGVNLTVNRGETVAIVGESGSGKSVSAKAIMGILAKNGTIDRGQITFSYYRNPEERVTREILQMKKEEIRRHINGKRIAMVFQDPMTSLNPLMPVGKQIMEGMILSNRSATAKLTSPIWNARGVFAVTTVADSAPTTVRPRTEAASVIRASFPPTFVISLVPSRYPIHIN